MPHRQLQERHHLRGRGRKGILRYGHPRGAAGVERVHLKETAYLLINGELPTQKELTGFRSC